jgi:hypothetical protein
MLDHEEQRSAWKALHYVRHLRHNGDTATAVLVAEEALEHLGDGGQMPPEVFVEFHVALIAERAAALGEIDEELSRVRDRRRRRRRPRRPHPTSLRTVTVPARLILVAIALAAAGWAVGRLTAVWFQMGR